MFIAYLVVIWVGLALTFLVGIRHV